MICIAFSHRVRGRRSCGANSNRDHRLKAQYQKATKKVTECDLSRGSRRRGRPPPPKKKKKKQAKLSTKTIFGFRARVISAA
jgi:hypothetical protein